MSSLYRIVSRGKRYAVQKRVWFLIEFWATLKIAQSPEAAQRALKFMRLEEAKSERYWTSDPL
jgi:hypothetical protein